MDGLDSEPQAVVRSLSEEVQENLYTLNRELDTIRSRLNTVVFSISGNHTKEVEGKTDPAECNSGGMLGEYSLTINHMSVRICDINQLIRQLEDVFPDLKSAQG